MDARAAVTCLLLQNINLDSTDRKIIIYDVRVQRNTREKITNKKLCTQLFLLFAENLRWLDEEIIPSNLCEFIVKLYKKKKKEKLNSLHRKFVSLCTNRIEEAPIER